MEVEPFTVRLASPMETAHGTIREREGFLVRIEHEGKQGLGEATPLPGWTESYSECREGLERANVVQEELDWGIALTKLDAPAARHGISLALLDARAGMESVPLYQYLGASDAVERVPVHATIGAGTTPDETASAARNPVDEGFETLKIKAGTRPVEEDIERIRAVRNEVGDDISIRVDANGAWTSEQANRAIDALAALAAEFVEQPLPTAELEATAPLRDNGVAIALDESLVAHDVETIIELEAADVLVIKPMVLGGPDLATAAARRGREAGIEPVISTTIDAVVARTAAIHVAASIPDISTCGLATGDWLATDLARDPAPVSDGAIRVPQDEGLGVPERP